jgi:hypothetical protein
MMTLNGEVYKFTQPQGDQLWLVISPKHRQELLTFEGYGFVYIKMETLIYFSAYHVGLIKINILERLNFWHQTK